MTHEKTASIISFIFNPAVTAAFTFLILLYPLQSIRTFLLLMATCVAFGTMIPLVMMIQLTKRGLISDFNVSLRQERARPFVGAAISYLAGSGILWLLRAPTIIVALMLCYAGNTLIMLLITLRWKISVHARLIAATLLSSLLVTPLIALLDALAGMFMELVDVPDDNLTMPIVAGAVMSLATRL
jgi:hypothetical protein